MCIRDRYRKRHETSPDPPAYKSAKKPGMEGGNVTLEMTLPLATSSRPPTTSTLGEDEIEDQVQNILNQVFALRLETV